ncbi:hypothetical protein GALMADRAFT_140176 [Galerina marginata CBS 339.88]|uniref:Uncharacterized protein n=1 Tax=Galerina marginata (strain CBS 339.88) TaxID=685588 RepID=A0A067SXC7_GALM3|nr:hypothetical protein GALMADRAFT_140176 [Galerina marginata CBS 339.88]
MPSVRLTEYISYYFAEGDLRPTDNPYAVMRQRMERARMTRADLADQNTPKAQRPVASNKRVEKYRTQQQESISTTVSATDTATGSAGGQLLQSITATPALNHSSFEELRLECYLQSVVAKGSPPLPVNVTESPWEVIPPVFNAFKFEEDEEDADLFLNEVVMEDCETGQ